MNALDLYNESGDARWHGFATTLVADVHGTLGRHRPDEPRSGWLSGLSEAEGARQPTRGGLRIGKPRPERGPAEPYDERLEWDRDGQYWHYLTKWMDALSRAAAILAVVSDGQDHAVRPPSPRRRCFAASAHGAARCKTLAFYASNCR